MPREATPNELSASWRARERCQREGTPDRFIEIYREELADDDPASRDASLALQRAAPFSRYDPREAEASAKAQSRCEREGKHDAETFRRYYKAELGAA